MTSSQTHLRRPRTAQFLTPYPARAPLSAHWREGAALAGGFVVLVVTTWLIWAALAEAALALAGAV